MSYTTTTFTASAEQDVLAAIEKQVKLDMSRLFDPLVHEEALCIRLEILFGRAVSDEELAFYKNKAREQASLLTNTGE